MSNVAKLNLQCFGHMIRARMDELFLCVLREVTSTAQKASRMCWINSGTIRTV